MTGNPRFDKYWPDNALREKTRCALNVPVKSRLIVFMSVPTAPDGLGGLESYLSQKDHRTIIQSVYSIAGESLDWIVAVKPHPEEPVAVHEDFFRSTGKFSKQIRLITQMDSFELINAADLVITCHSTTGLEAIYLDRKSVV